MKKQIRVPGMGIIAIAADERVADVKVTRVMLSVSLHDDGPNSSRDSTGLVSEAQTKGREDGRARIGAWPAFVMAAIDGVDEDLSTLCGEPARGQEPICPDASVDEL